MKPCFAVVFSPDAPIIPALAYPKVINTPHGRLIAINCTNVLETTYGFLQLIQKKEGEIQPLALMVPPSYILWMAQAEHHSQLGFLAAMK